METRNWVIGTCLLSLKIHHVPVKSEARIGGSFIAVIGMVRVCMVRVSILSSVVWNSIQPWERDPEKNKTAQAGKAEILRLSRLTQDRGDRDP